LANCLGEACSAVKPAREGVRRTWDGKGRGREKPEEGLQHPAASSLKQQNQKAEDANSGNKKRKVHGRGRQNRGALVVLEKKAVSTRRGSLIVFASRRTDISTTTKEER